MEYKKWMKLFSKIDLDRWLSGFDNYEPPVRNEEVFVDEINLSSLPDLPGRLSTA